MCISYIHSSKGWAFHHFVHFVLQKDIHRLITIDYMNARGLFHGAEIIVSASNLHWHFSRQEEEEGGRESRTCLGKGGEDTHFEPFPTSISRLVRISYPIRRQKENLQTCQACIMIYFKVYTGSTLLIL